MICSIQGVSTSTLFSFSLFLCILRGRAFLCFLDGVDASGNLFGLLLFHQGFLGHLFSLFFLGQNLAIDSPCGPSLLFCYFGPSLSYGPLLPSLGGCMDGCHLFSCGHFQVQVFSPDSLCVCDHYPSAKGELLHLTWHLNSVPAFCYILSARSWGAGSLFTVSSSSSW